MLSIQDLWQGLLTTETPLDPNAFLLLDRAVNQGSCIYNCQELLSSMRVSSSSLASEPAQSSEENT